MQRDGICYMHYKIAKNYLNPSIICYTILLIKCTKRLENKFIQSMQQEGFRLYCGAVSFKVLLFYTFFPIQITCRLLIVWMALGYSQKWIQCNKKGKEKSWSCGLWLLCSNFLQQYKHTMVLLAKVSHFFGWMSLSLGLCLTAGLN